MKRKNIAIISIAAAVVVMAGIGIGGIEAITGYDAGKNDNGNKKTPEPVNQTVMVNLPSGEAVPANPTSEMYTSSEKVSARKSGYYLFLLNTLKNVNNQVYYGVFRIK